DPYICFANRIQGENLNEKLNELQAIIDENETFKDPVNRFQKRGKNNEFNKIVE
ncbi:38583_t:CDS:2, partial [Gigaspora margarita]